MIFSMTKQNLLLLFFPYIFGLGFSGNKKQYDTEYMTVFC